MIDLDGEPYVEPVENPEEWKTHKYDIFRDILRSINTKSGHLLDKDPEAVRDYLPFVINLVLSRVDKYGKNDSILFANELNTRGYMSDKMQYDFLYYGLPKAARYGEPVKPESINNLELVMEYYQCSPKKAKEIVQVLTVEQIETIKGRMFTGEIKNVKSRKSVK